MVENIFVPFTPLPRHFVCRNTCEHRGTAKAAASWFCLAIFRLQFSESPEVQAWSALSATAAMQTNPFLRTATAALCGRT